MPYNSLDPSTAAVAPTTTAGAPLTSVGMTLASIQTELGLQLAGRGDVGAARLAAWINMGYQELVGMLNINEARGSVDFSLVADQPFYLVPVQIASINRFSVINETDFPIQGGRELEMIDLQTYRRLPDETDEPVNFFRYRRMLVIWPTPLNDRTAPMEFKVRPDDLVNPTDSPFLPVEFHYLLLMKARVVAFRGLLMWSDAISAQNDFITEARPLLDTDAEEMQGANPGMSPIRRRDQLIRAPGQQRYRNWRGDW